MGSLPKSRLLVAVAAIAVTAVAVTIGVLSISSALRDRVEIPKQNVVVEAIELAEATGFYDDSLVPDAPTLAEVSYTEEEVSRESILRIFLLHESDLLADYCLVALRDVITDEQVIDAKLLAQQYNSRLKALRRERAKIMEQAGVALKDPTQELEKIRIKTHYLLAEVRKTIMQEVLTNEQRQMIFLNANPEAFAERKRLLDERSRLRAERSALLDERRCLLDERLRLYEERERLIEKRDQHSANKEWDEMLAAQKLVKENLDSILELEKKFKELNSKQAEIEQDSLIENPASER